MRLGLDLNPLGFPFGPFGFWPWLRYSNPCLSQSQFMLGLKPGQKHQGHMLLALFSRGVSAIWPTLQCSFTWFAVFWFALERLKPSPLGQLSVMAYQNSDTLLDCSGFSLHV